MSTLLLRTRPAPSGFIEPCLPSTAAKPPSGIGWIHEIKHDGYRVMVRRDAAGVRILTRNGHDWTSRFPLIASAANVLRAKSFLIDGKAVACDASGLAVFQRLRKRRNDASVFLYAFDLVQLNGHDLRREPVEVRKAALEKLLRPKPDGMRFCEHIEYDDAAMMFEHACQLRRHRVEAARLALRVWAIPGLDQDKESERARCQAGSGRGLDKVTSIAA
jgi:bifunctional non-homologous end joining protein LigD